MPQKRQVYGKSKAVFKVSSTFGSDSPAKPVTEPRALNQRTQAPIPKRNPLADVDLNARLQVLSLDTLKDVNFPTSKPVSRPTQREQTNPATLPPTQLPDPQNNQAISFPLSPARSPKAQKSSLPNTPKSPSDNIDGSSCSLVRKDHLGDLRRLQSGDIEATVSLRTFASWGEEMQQHFHIDKIAEATYGEVYRLRLKHEHPSLTANDESVLKVIALKSPVVGDGEENMSSIDSVISEVQLLQRMTSIPGFVNFRDISVLRGRPGKFVASAWRVWNKGKSKAEKSQFPDPARKSSYSDQQLWAIVEMQDAGMDLEKVELPTVLHAWDVFWSVALSLAKAEEECRFEHRDLHLGNICVRDRSVCGSTDQVIRKPRSGRKLGYTTLETTIIDYTLGRADLLARDDSGESAPLQTPVKQATTDGTDLGFSDNVAFSDLSQDPEIFGGNAEDNYQYEIYRMMRSVVDHGDPVHHIRQECAADEHNEGPTDELGAWRDHHPLTNVVWLHFVLESLLKGLISWPSEEGGMEDIMAYNRYEREQGIGLKETATFKRSALKIERTLRAVRNMLKVETMHAIAQDGLASAADLIWLALEEKWLNKDDVSGPSVV